MAEDAASRTEEATPHRLEQARKDGDVAKSMELSQACALAGAFAALAMGGAGMAQSLARALTPFIAHADQMRLAGAAGVAVSWQVAAAAAPALLAVLGATMLAGIGGNVVQHGLLWVPSKLKFDLQRVSPAEGFKRLFGIDGLMGFVRSVLKVVLVSAVAWWALAPHTREIPNLIGLPPAQLLAYSADVGKTLLFAVLALLALVGLLDFLWQRQRHTQRLKMSKEELKEDMRQSEGDPHIKARQRSIRMQRARQRMIQNVPKATVVVVNPTHYAVALRYEQGQTPAPECVAKGVDEVALKIREVAAAHGVPVIEDPPLARALYAGVEIDQVIPTEHYEAVAKIIGFILAGRRGPRRARQL
jgi:flagellar biosynthetic protein FlhB